MENIMIEVTRGDLVECIHRGHVAVVDLEGDLKNSFGDPDYLTYIRSAAKPIQALEVVEKGCVESFDLKSDELSVMCGSHFGEEFHRNAVKSTLEKIGLNESHLNPGVHEPFSKKDARKLIKEGKELTEIYSNCSGKHSGMLALCVKEGYSLENYIDLKHPVQQGMLKQISYYTEMKEDDIIIGLDGCGVPVFGMPLYNMALSYAKISSPDKIPERRQDSVRTIIKAMMDKPEYVAGTGGLCTVLMKAFPGKIIAKLGADGIYCIGLVDKGIGIALKIEDGAQRALGPSVVSILLQLGIIDKSDLNKLSKFYPRENRNHHKQKVGEIRPVFSLNNL